MTKLQTTKWQTTKWQTITVDEAEQMLADSDIVLFDMRDYRSYLAGHHPKALHLSEQNLRAMLKHTNRAVPVIIYCYHGHSSQDMAQLFSDFGFARSYSVDGGYEAWLPLICHQHIKLADLALGEVL